MFQLLGTNVKSNGTRTHTFIAQAFFSSWVSPRDLKLFQAAFNAPAAIAQVASSSNTSAAKATGTGIAGPIRILHLPKAPESAAAAYSPKLDLPSHPSV